ncbi:hypothetical protein M1D88_18960 [Arthrobacter sp. R1-13]
MNSTLERFSKLLEKDGTWCTVLADAGTGTVDSLEAADVRPGQIRDALLAAGAAKADAQAVEQAIQPLEGVQNPVARFLLVHDGRVEVDEVLAGERVDSPYVKVGVAPDLLPLLRHADSDIPVVTASVDRSGADIKLAYARRAITGGSESSHSVQGSTENLKKVPGGGWSQGQFQHRTEEIWRKNAEDVAAEINRLVQAERPAIVAIGGDIRARDLVLHQLSENARAIATTVDSHTRAGGAHPEVMDAAVEKLLAENQAYSQRRLLEQLEEEKGHSNGKAATGIGAVVHALQQAQVQTLVLSTELTSDPGGGNTATDPDSNPAREMLVLGSSPWVATVEEETLGAQILGKASAAAALIRAAVLTDADVEILPKAAIPGGAVVAALLRWPVGPPVPGEG